MNIFKFLASDNYIILNVDVIHTFGLDEAIMIGELAKKQKYWQDSKRLDEHGGFFLTIDDCEADTGLSRFKQDKSIAHLEELGIVKCSSYGMPMKRHFYINWDEFENKFSSLQASDNQFVSQLQPVCKPVTNQFVSQSQTICKPVTSTNTSYTNTSCTNTSIKDIEVQGECVNSSSLENNNLVEMEKSSKKKKSPPFEKITKAVNEIGTPDYLNDKIYKWAKVWIGEVNATTLASRIKNLPAKFNGDVNKMEASVDMSIAKGWKDFYEPKTYDKQTPYTSPKQQVNKSEAETLINL